MNAPPLIIPPKNASTRTDAEHAAIYVAYIVEGMSAAQTAEMLIARFPTSASSCTRAAIVAYADRQGWEKGAPGGHGRIPQASAKPLRSGKRPPGKLSVILADVDPVIGHRSVGGDSQDVRRKSCRWPVGPQLPAWRMAEQLFCGEPQDPALAPYCRACAEIAYPPPSIQKRLASHGFAKD